MKVLPGSGYCLLPGVLSGAEVAALRELLPPGQYKIRDCLQKFPAAAQFLQGTGFAAASGDLPIRRSVYFAKPPDFNWQVPWHQDVLIQVAERRELPGYTAWSCKEGVWHVQPPLAMMRQVLSARLHLSDCGEDDGPLRLLPGSHRGGYTDFAGLGQGQRPGEVVITCRAGDVLLFSPLLLHSSLPARSDRPRAVLHVELCDAGLPDGLQWNVASR